MDQIHYNHLYNRAGFGIYSNFKRQASKKLEVNKLFEDARLFKPFDVVTMPSVSMGQTTQEMRLQRLKQSREEMIILNSAWVDEMLSSPAVLRERMSFFWHDHFACRHQSAILAQRQINTIRQHALGKFGDLLKAISKDGAMLRFLNNQQNKKNSPNENFAREVMELFTLGRGNYTEGDIKNAARAFTGWTTNNITGEFIIRNNVHDHGIKTFRGRRGNFSGDDILNMILEDKRTSRFITEKIWRYFVHTENLSEELLVELSNLFYKSEYDIEKLMHTIFSSEWFYSNTYIGNRIKSPIDFIVGLRLHTQGRFEHSQSQVFLQRTLGQVLLVPPNVGGWPEGTAWIDSSSLTLRLSLPRTLLQQADSDIRAKEEGDANNVVEQITKVARLTFLINWQNLNDQFTNHTTNEVIEKLEKFLFVKPIRNNNKKLITTYANEGSDQDFLKRALIACMSLPEYQLN